VDSMVLLDMLRRQPGLELVVAHADHGIRADAAEDEVLVRGYAHTYHLRYVAKRLMLGLGTSEAAARTARYNFLQQCRKNEDAIAIITAHHQDDMIETALITIMRGTGWRGLAPFMPQRDVLRPLLILTKNDIIGYARKHRVPWREDSTNTDESYLRNYIRHTLIPTLDQKSMVWRTVFLQHIRKQQQLRAKITKCLDTLLGGRSVLSRYNIIMHPPEISYEIIQHACTIHTGNTLERSLAESAVLFAKVAKPGKVLELNKDWQLRAESANVVVEPRRPMVSFKEH
jgi:tRNA(Ile)-lysidine synthase